MTATMGRMHSDAQFTGSSSVPAHDEMMGFLGIGNNPMVGATVAVAVELMRYIRYYNNDRIKLRLKGKNPVQYQALFQSKSAS